MTLVPYGKLEGSGALEFLALFIILRSLKHNGIVYLSKEEKDPEETR